MKNKDLIRIYEGLNAVKKLAGVKFAYAVAKNLKLLTSEIENLQEGIKPTREIDLYEEERIEMCKKHAKKEEQGKPVINGGEYVIIDISAFNTELETLKEKYKKDLELQKEHLAEYTKMLDEDTSLVLHQVSIDVVPDGITGEQLEAIFEIIKD